MERTPAQEMVTPSAPLEEDFPSLPTRSPLVGAGKRAKSPVTHSTGATIVRNANWSPPKSDNTNHITNNSPKKEPTNDRPIKSDFSEPIDTEDIVFNYSNIVLSEPMKRLLNRGLNFSIVPNKMDLTQVLTDFKRFERSIIWFKYWYGRDSDHEREKLIFRTENNNMPKNYTPPEGLRVFLS